jgi:hypothetical protein
MRRVIVLAILASVLVGPCTAGAAAAAEVPLSLFTNVSYPNGVNFGGTMGISFGDYDGDGYTDVVTGWTGNLWRNVGGTDWQFAADLSSVMPPAERRYGFMFGDYDNDGLGDVAASPRVPAWGDDRFHLLHNAGGGANFVDVASDPSIVDVQPYGNGETLCWADVNGDGNLDLFVPTYPGPSGPGNFFLLNQGATGPQGAHRFVETSAASGLDNPPWSLRPEGAQFLDVDGDGDVDLYANGTLYQDVGTEGAATFNALTPTASGIGLASSLDEGALFFDYDLDGDFDLVAAYSIEGVRIWENRGDGTFAAAEPGIVDAPMTGLNLGMSAEDWDNDGDIDFTTRGVFRRNRLAESGTRRFTVATTDIPAADLVSATPAWGDWDRDGDLDCALGNWGYDGRLYQNTMYSPSTVPSDKHYVRVRPVRDAKTIARGLETEYGATIEVSLASGNDPYRRRKFTASSHGYLNQNEYTVQFGLPDASAVDVSVDFPGPSADGIWRVDKQVNPILGQIAPAELANHELTVTRCGDVLIDGVIHDALPFATSRLSTTAGGLVLPGASAPPDPVPSPQSDWFTGLAFDTIGSKQRNVIKEIILDGQLDAPSACAAGNRNIALWDVTDPAHPAVVAGGALLRTTSSRNRRTTFPVSIVLEPDRSFRLVARVTEERPTTITAPLAFGGVTLRGGLSFKDLSACGGKKLVSAHPVPTTTSLAIRFAPVPLDARPDPVGASLHVARGTGGNIVLAWQDVPAPGYRVRRCLTTTGPCQPAVYADATVNGYTDTTVTLLPGEALWYVVNAVNECAARL